MKPSRTKVEAGKKEREPSYPAARAVAPTVAAHFARHAAEARSRGEHDLAHGPDAGTVEAIIDATFWASLRREEGRSPKISLAYLPPEQAGEPLRFERRLALDPNVLTKLAPAVERPGIHLGVWHEPDGELRTWGATRDIPDLCFVLEVVEPGLLVVKHSRVGGTGKFVNVAVLRGQKVKVIDEHGASLPDCPELLTSLLGFASPSALNDSVNVLIQLAVSMRAHERGGSLLVVPAGTEEWRESIVIPIPYVVAPAYSGLANLMRRDEDERDSPAWQAELRRAVDAVAGLTAVDGATIISDRYELLAFGAKIGRPQGSVPVERMVVTEPVVGNEGKVVHPARHGGTRHLSAAQFVSDQRDSLALIASQDGRFTIFAWSPCETMVHAHRVDSLLL